MCNRSSNAVLALFNLCLVLSLGHVCTAQEMPNHAKTEYPASGIYAGNLKFTDGVTTHTRRVEMRVYRQSRRNEFDLDLQENVTIEIFPPPDEDLDPLNPKEGLPQIFKCHFLDLRLAQMMKLPGSNIKGPGAGIDGKVTGGILGEDIESILEGTVVRTPIGVRVSLEIDNEEVQGDLSRVSKSSSKFMGPGGP